MKIRAFVKKSHLFKTISQKIRDRIHFDHGWGNGYVVIPKGHPLHGVQYDNIDVKIHGGLTFSQYVDNLGWDELNPEDKGGWVIGFDTSHAWDDLIAWPKEKVLREANYLKKQILNYDT